MGRKRRTNKGLPSRVYLKHGAFYFVTTGSKWIRLGQTQSEMYRRLSELSIEHSADNTMNAVFKCYKDEVLPSPRSRSETIRIFIFG